MKTLLALALCTGLFACGDDDGGPAMDAGTDTAVLPDTGGRDSALPDTGTADPCTATDMNAISTVGCNGEPVGPSAAADTFYGVCTPGDESNPAGSCTEPNAICSAGMGETEGVCLTACPPVGSYVTTGNCPTGSRCFTLDMDVAICFSDCRSAADCRTGDMCDSEGSCVGTPAMMDGGVMDGGPMDGGVMDAAPMDAAATDAAPMDAGPAADAGAGT